MSQTVLFIELLLVHYATQTAIEAKCNENVALKCPDVDLNKKNFITVTWYKTQSHKKHGIIRRRKGSNVTQIYNFPREASFGEEYSLVMSSVMPNDSGKYECGIQANIGGQNLNPEVNLIVLPCDIETQVTTLTTALYTNESTTICQTQVAELPIMWISVGFMAVGCAKVILCLIGIWVIRFFRQRRYARQGQRFIEADSDLSRDFMKML